jgi:iron complex transport system permease protein
MKYLIDVDDLEATGLVDAATATLLRSQAKRDTGSTAINILLALGAIAVAAGFLALTQSVQLTLGIGAAFLVAGFVVRRSFRESWGKLGSIWMIIGALTLCAGIGIVTDQPQLSAVAAALILAATAYAAESALLAALVPLTLASAIGSSTGYWHACYGIMVREPTLTIALFATLAAAGWFVHRHFSGLLSRLALVFTRMSVILVNFGFWVGSLWGDTPFNLWKNPEDSWTSIYNPQISPIVFVIGWAVALIAAGFWAAKNGRQFLVNTVAVFGSIHLYTQWFERFGAEPISVILGGIATIAIGLTLWRYNRGELERQRGETSPA